MGRIYWEEKGKIPDEENSSRSHWTMYKFASSFVDKNDVVLDFGCGCGGGSVMLSTVCKNVMGIDNSNEALTYARENNSRDNIDYNEINIENVKDLGIKFDKILAIEIMEHLSEPREKIDMVMSWLKPNGIMIMTFPVDSHGGSHVVDFRVDNIDGYLKGLNYVIKYVSGDKTGQPNFFIIVQKENKYG